MSRLKLLDNPLEVIIKMSDGNLGAITFFTNLFKQEKYIDPDSLFGVMSPIFALDRYKIYGHNIWILYKDCCGEKIENVIAVLRVVQLGLKSEVWLLEHIKAQKALACDEIMRLVQSKLPAFNNPSVSKGV